MAKIGFSGVQCLALCSCSGFWFLSSVELDSSPLIAKKVRVVPREKWIIGRDAYGSSAAVFPYFRHPH